jgi:thiol-disulfide isomerase/thioredoxin
VLVIDVWQASCGPCAAAAPYLIRTYQRFSRVGVTFIGLTPDSATLLPDTKKFIETLKIPWLNGYGAAATIQDLEVIAIPTLFVIGKDGKVAWHSGLAEDLESALQRALAAPAI